MRCVGDLGREVLKVNELKLRLLLMIGLPGLRESIERSTKGVTGLVPGWMKGHGRSCLMKKERVRASRARRVESCPG